MERGKGTVARFYRRLDEDLAGSAFIAGDKFTIADITALCAVDFAAGAARVPVPDDCGNLKRWHAEVSARPQRKSLSGPPAEQHCLAGVSVTGLGVGPEWAYRT